MHEDPLGWWERDFRAAARDDDSVTLRLHLRRLGLPNRPKLMLNGTISVVRMCSAYASLDGRERSFRRFLNIQTYNPKNTVDAHYVFTFDIAGKAYGRIVTNTKLQTIDLADLYGSAWHEYEIQGFHRFWISHPDWSPFTRKEVKKLEEEVTNDLRFDYAEDELNFWFEESEDKSSLMVTLHDVEKDDA